MNKWLTIVVALLFALLTVSVSAQDAEWELTETQIISYSSVSGPGSFHIDFPAGWLVDEKAGMTVINELDADHLLAFGAPFSTDGYSIRWTFLSPGDLRDLPNPSDRTQDDLLATISAQNDFQEPLDVSETTFAIWPALQVRAVDGMGNYVITILGLYGEDKVNAFFITLAAPSAEALDVFLPTWDAIIESTYPKPLELPAPTGAFQVGKTSRHWVDETREETLTPDPDDHRELVIRIWYPAEIDMQGIRAPYFEDFSGPMGEQLLEEWGAARVLGLSSLNPHAQEILQAITHAFLHSSVSNKQSRYPVLIFSPASQDIPEEYTVQFEELASHGYVVVGIHHPYCSGITVFPDRRTVSGRGSSIDLERTCTQDILFVLDQLEVMNDSDPEGFFTGRLDLERIGAFGHSLGGWIVVLAGSLDDRIRAALNEDGPTVPIDYDVTRLEQPLMYFAQPNRRLYPSAGPNYLVLVDQFEHRSFTDNPLYPLAIPEIGSIDGDRAVDIVRAYVLAFFDKYLKGEDSGLLDGPSEEYPQVNVMFQTRGS